MTCQKPMLQSITTTIPQSLGAESTYPACRAILAARQQGADFEDKMIAAIQTAYYQRAKNPSLQSTFSDRFRRQSHGVCWRQIKI